MKHIHTFDALSNPNFLRLFLGQFGTAMGQMMDDVTRGWLIYALTHSPLQLGLVGAARGIPMLLFSLPAGVVADKYSRRTQLVLFVSINAFLSLALATLVLTGKVAPWHVYVTAFFAGSGQAFQFPARMALVNDIVGKEKIQNAVALNSAAFNVSRSIGPALAGILITYLGVSGAYYTEGAVFLCTAFLTAGIQVPESTKEAMQRQARLHISFGRSITEGLKYVVFDKLILSLVVLALAPQVLGYSFTSLFPIFAVDILRVGATGQGLLLSSLGVGAFVGAMGVASKRGNPQGKALLLCAAVFGLSLVFFSQSPWMLFSMCTVFVGGIAYTSFNTQAQTLIQILSPDQLRGRILSIYMMNRGLLSLGSMLAGTLANFLGAPNAVMSMGFFCIALALIMSMWVRGLAALGSAVK